jgi:hypothetical protein
MNDHKTLRLYDRSFLKVYPLLLVVIKANFKDWIAETSENLLNYLILNSYYFLIFVLCLRLRRCIFGLFLQIFVTHNHL